MRGSFFASLGLHALVIVVMIWASQASESKQKPLPSATVVKLVRPQGLPLPIRSNPTPPPQGEGQEEEPVVPKFPVPGKDKNKQPIEQPKAPPKSPTAPTNPSKHPGIPGGKEVQGQAGTLVVGNGFDYDFYLQLIQSKISQNFRPPPGIRGSATPVMAFTIQKSGEISNVKLAQPSGNLLVDQAAERAIRAAGHFPPLPAQYDQGSLDINFVFEINSGAGR